MYIFSFIKNITNNKFIYCCRDIIEKNLLDWTKRNEKRNWGIIGKCFVVVSNLAIFSYCNTKQKIYRKRNKAISSAKSKAGGASSTGTTVQSKRRR